MQGGNDQQPNSENNPSDQSGIDSESATDNEIFSSNEQIDETPDASLVSWEASEYIHHHKDSSWYFGFGAVMVVVVGLIFILTRELFSVLTMIVMGVAVAVYAGRKPDTVKYSLSSGGITIGNRFHDFNDFSSFALMQEGGVYSIMLTPTKRFMPPVSIYFSPDDGDKIVDVLSRVLPHEDRQPDIVDRFMRNIRF